MAVAKGRSSKGDTTKTLKAGDPAPDFELVDQNKNTVKLSDYRGKKNVMLTFHPLAFTGVCQAQMSSYEADKSQFDRYDTVVLGISVDSQPAHAAWAKEMGTTFPLLADFYPHGAVAQKYGIFIDERGFAERAVIIVDKQSIVRYIDVHQTLEQPDNEAAFEVLRKL